MNARTNSYDPYAVARADIDQRLGAFMQGADVWAKRSDLDADLAARANDFIAGAKQLLKEAEEARKAEKKPHTDAAKAVDQSWDAIKSRIEKVIGVVRPLLEGYLRKQQEAKRAAEAEARRKADEAEAAARAAAADAASAETAQARIEAEERADAQARIAEEERQRATRAAAPARVDSATGLANRRSLKTVRKAKITSLPQALQHYAKRPEVADLILQLANAELRHAPTVRGEKQIPNIPGIGWDETQEIAA